MGKFGLKDALVAASPAKIVGSAGTAAGGGLDNISDSLGLSGKQGEYYQPTAAPKQNDQALLTAQQAANDQGSTEMQNLLSSYGQGGTSLSEALSGRGGSAQAQSGEWKQALKGAMVTDPITGSRLATDQVQSNPMLGQLYGKGGALESITGEERNLANRGYSLKPEDYEAYGQTSGDISRMFGQQEQGLAQSLADRGLSQAPNGAAAIGFSGLAGNKNEMLAKAQTSIADKRMAMNLERLNSARQQQQALGKMGGQEIQNQYGRNLSGVQEQRAGSQDLIANQQAKHAQDIEQWKAQNVADLASMQNKQGEKGTTLGEAFGSGLKSSAAGIGAAPGEFTKGAAGKAGGAATGGGAR